MTTSKVNHATFLKPRSGRLPVILDTDAFNEIDDQFAIVQMLLAPERFDVRAITAAPFHNTRSTGPGHGMDLSYDEILRLLERLGMTGKVPVYRGVTEYVGPRKQPRNGDAVTFIIDAARSASPEDPVYVIAIGAISNVASALLTAPDIADRMVVVWLAGHAPEWPDVMEFNLRQDVGGAQVLFDSGVPLVLIPARPITSHLHSTVPEIEAYVEPHGEIGRFLAMRFKEYSKEHRGWSKPIWDMAAIAWLIEPDWVPTVLMPSPVLTSEVTWSVDRRRHQIRCATFVHRDPIMRDFFARLEAFAQPSK
jgi:inosine-uridine nucleoside N-ribohydrolase